MPKDARCGNCGEPAGRHVSGDRWLCYSCGVWQPAVWCPLCGEVTMHPAARAERARQLSTLVDDAKAEEQQQS